MRSILQFCLLLLLFGAGAPAWGKVTADPPATAWRAVEDSAFRLGDGAPPARPASGEAAMWGLEVAGAGNGRPDSTPTTAGLVVVPVRGTAFMACPGAPPSASPGATTNLAWVMVGPKVYAYVKENPWSGFDAHGLCGWLNRDPIGINGGVNLYGMVGNDPVNRWDYLGLAEEPQMDPNYSDPTEIAKKRNPYWEYLTTEERKDAIKNSSVITPPASPPTPDKKLYKGKFGCCDAATIAAGKAAIKAQAGSVSFSQLTFKLLYGENYSCYNCNSTLWAMLKCAPCWSLYLENRRWTQSPVKDHWLVVGFAVDKTGRVVDTLVLDKTGGMTDLPTYRKTFDLLWNLQGQMGGPGSCLTNP